jgi:TolA-binding protein
MQETKKRQRFWLPLVVLALVIALALGGCAKGAQNTGAPGNQTTNSSQTPGSTASPSGSSNTSNELQHLQQTDQQNQNDLNNLNNDDQNANQNNGNDQEIVP